MLRVLWNHTLMASLQKVLTQSSRKKLQPFPIALRSLVLQKNVQMDCANFVAYVHLWTEVAYPIWNLIILFGDLKGARITQIIQPHFVQIAIRKCISIHKRKISLI